MEPANYITSLPGLNMQTDNNSDRIPSFLEQYIVRKVPKKDR